MKLFYRALLLIITLLFMFAALILALYGFGLSSQTGLALFIDDIYGNWQYGLLFLLFFAGGAWLLYPYFVLEKDIPSTIINKTELGEVDISLKAVENLVQGIVYQQENIEEVKTELTSTETGLKIFLKGKVKPNTMIPDMTDELQKIVKSYIEDTTGVDVEEVKVLIEDIYDNEPVVEKSRVE